MNPTSSSAVLVLAAGAMSALAACAANPLTTATGRYPTLAEAFAPPDRVVYRDLARAPLRLPAPAPELIPSATASSADPRPGTAPQSPACPETITIGPGLLSDSLAEAWTQCGVSGSFTWNVGTIQELWDWQIEESTLSFTGQDPEDLAAAIKTHYGFDATIDGNTVEIYYRPPEASGDHR